MIKKIEVMPRKEYKTITVNLKTFMRFVRAVKNARLKEPKIRNSEFLDLLLDLHKQ